MQGVQLDKLSRVEEQIGMATEIRRSNPGVSWFRQPHCCHHSWRRLPPFRAASLFLSQCLALCLPSPHLLCCQRFTCACRSYMIRDCGSFRTTAGSKDQTYGDAVPKASTGKSIVTHDASLLVIMELSYKICLRIQSLYIKCYLYWPRRALVLRTIKPIVFDPFPMFLFSI